MSLRVPPSVAWAGAAALSFVGVAFAPTPSPRPAFATAWAGDEEAVRPDFRSEVLPILERRCAECHGSHLRRPKARLLLTREGLLRGGPAGTSLVPGDADGSLVVQAVRYDDELLQMPPDGKLPQDEINVLERWVATGAEWPDGVEAKWREPQEVEAAETAAQDVGAVRETPERPTFSPDELAFFEREVRPLLAANCFDCHGPEVERPKAGLRMDSREALLAGGESGPALVPGDVEASLLVHAVRYDGEVKMPPLGRLDPSEIATLERWAERGAPWPPAERSERASETVDALDVAAGRERWAFRPVERPDVPDVRGSEFVDTPIDAFVVARLEEAGLAPAPLAEPRELYRRLAFDLIGLPPTVDEVRAFEEAYGQDPEAAFDAAIERFLDRPEYGERWARHWLDVVRFSQTNGYERDSEKPFAWRYRDWVVDALNADLPYDEFLRYQLAGDETPGAGSAGLIATGFYRLGTWDDEPADPIEAEFDELDDVLRTITEGMLGVTIGCARCHDHRFDPFPQEDYYSLLAFVRGVERYTETEFSFSSSTLRPLDDSPAAIERWRKDQALAKRALQAELSEILRLGRGLALRERLAGFGPEVLAAYDRSAGERTPADIALLKQYADQRPDQDEALAALSPDDRLRSRAIAAELQAEGTSTPGSLEWALAVRESAEPPPTHLLLRGRAARPGPELEPRFPSVLVPDAAPPPPPAIPTGATSGRRTQLADWIASPEHPLTARVIVNRVWQHHFGRGIVATPNDFGSTGIPPTHPELLDWLAAEFVAGGWSLKDLHRAILRSRTWRQSSRVADEAATRIDPAGELLWRQRIRRLEAEALRDALLAVSGTLNRERGGRGFFPAVSREALAGMSKPGLGWEPSGAEQRSRRSLYTFAMRGLAVPFLQSFDAPVGALPVGARPTTTLATQALTLLNSDLASRAALALARQVEVDVEAEADGEAAQLVERLFERALARSPSAAERALATDFLAEQTKAFAAEPHESIFRPAVPPRLEVRYHGQLAGADMLHGPREHWSYHVGNWGGGYNGTLEADPDDGPYALAEGVQLPVDGRFEVATSAELERGADLTLFFGDADADRIECVLRASEGRVELRGAQGSERRLLAAQDGAFEPGSRFELVLAFAPGEVRLSLDGGELLRAELRPEQRPRGHIGLRVTGESVRLRGLTFLDGEAEHRFDDPPLPAELRALASLSLVLLNHNEFAYVD